MNCIKFREPQTFKDLPKREQDRLYACMEECVRQNVFNEEADMQINWLKIACINLRDMGFTEDQMLMFIGSWKNLYRKNSRMRTKEEQQNWLNEEMKVCFPNTGFPTEQVESMKKV